MARCVTTVDITALTAKCAALSCPHQRSTGLLAQPEAAALAKAIIAVIWSRDGRETTAKSRISQTSSAAGHKQEYDLFHWGNRNRMAITLQTILLLTLANVFMTFAWYGHLRNLSDKPWWIASLLSWSIALFEYMLQVPANRIGFNALSLPQLKMLQEVITLSVFVPFALLYMKQPLSWNYLWAGLCLLGAVYFLFKN